MKLVQYNTTKVTRQVVSVMYLVIREVICYIYVLIDNQLIILIHFMTKVQK